MEKKDEFERILRAKDLSLMQELQKPLTHDEIEFRVSRVANGYAYVLAYKDARVDMNRLDSVVGPMNWKRDHQGDYCTVSLFNSSTGEWVSKQDIGTESNTEKEKGKASDSFKRACFNWGIGRELYDYPEIKIKLMVNEAKIYPKNWNWFSQITDGKLTYLGCKDLKGVKRFEWGKLVKA